MEHARGEQHGSRGYRRDHGEPDDRDDTRTPSSARALADACTQSSNHRPVVTLSVSLRQLG